MDFSLKKLPNKILIPLIVAVAFTGGFFAHKLTGIYYGFEITKPSPTEFTDTEKGQPVGLDFSLFWDVWNLISERHIDKNEFDLVKMRDGAIAGMLEAIGDPFTSYLPPKESKQFFEDIGGKFSGVGIEIGKRDGVLTVIAPLEDTPAAKAGMLAGDKIIKIDDTITADLELDEAVQLIRGKKGTPVVLTVNRNGDTLEFNIVRDDIKITAVRTKMIDDDIAYIKITTFNQNADSEFEKAAKKIIDTGTEKIILDLRNNPGGLLESAIYIAGWFLESEDIITIEDFGNGELDLYRAAQSGSLKDAKVIVLINQGSASASEIVAGALRDSSGIKLIGETTFGKGSVQEVEHLKDNSSVKYTVARWLTPSGHSIDETGLAPDIEVELTKEDIEEDLDPQLNKAIEIIRDL